MLKRVSCLFVLFFLYFMSYSEQVPIDLVREYFHLELLSNGEPNLIVLSGKGIKISFVYGSPYAEVNGVPVYLDGVLDDLSGKMVIPDSGMSRILSLLSSEKKIYTYADAAISEEDRQSAPAKSPEPSGSYVYTQKPEKITINAIVIDAGHGGDDPGTYRGDVIEKNITLSTALLLEKQLKALYPDKKIIMTRRTDVFVPLEKRSEIANTALGKYGQTVFISIHVNASISPEPYGFETWYIVDDYKRNVIEKNKVTDDKDIATILNSMVNDELYSESKNLAETIQKSLEKEIGSVSKSRGVKENTYIVVKKSIMPAVLVEIGFLSNKYEAKRLTNETYLHKITEGIVKGLSEFIYDYELSSGSNR